MTVAYQDQSHIDAGLEWGQMFFLAYASPELASEHYHPVASVKRVMVARRQINRGRGMKWTRFFVRLPDHEYAPSAYYAVLDHEPGYGDRLFLTEKDAWQCYVDWMTRYLDRLREKLGVGEQMLTEAEAIVRLKS